MQSALELATDQSNHRIHGSDSAFRLFDRGKGEIAQDRNLRRRMPCHPGGQVRILIRALEGPSTARRCPEMQMIDRPGILIPLRCPELALEDGLTEGAEASGGAGRHAIDFVLIFAADEIWPCA